MISAKVLADGQLPSSKGTIYTVPASTSAYVRCVRMHNTNTTDETINVYLKPGSTSRQVGRWTLATRETLEVDLALTLEAGDLIEADTTTASKVDYVITGAEET